MALERWRGPASSISVVGLLSLGNTGWLIPSTARTGRPRVRSWKSHLADVTTEFDSTLPPIPCSSREFNPVLLTLLINAAPYCRRRSQAATQQEGRHYPQHETRREWAEIEIRDSGPECPTKSAAASSIHFHWQGNRQGYWSGTRHDAVDYGEEARRERSGFERVAGKGTTLFLRLPLRGVARARA